jgi:lysine 2,3-aminomutase
MDSWKWQLANSATTVEDLRKHITISPELSSVIGKYRMRVTPYILSLMDDDPKCPIRRQFLPSVEELREARGNPDPKKEEGTASVSCLFHLYPDRLVLYLTNSCASFCRHCLRKRRFSHTDSFATRKELDEVFEYIKNRPEIRDILVTGGDPFLAKDELIEYTLKGLRAIPSIEIIRIGTRTLSTLPQRITPELGKMIAKYHPVWINTQFNHPKEITPEAIQAAEILLENGIPLGNQSVLLKGVNDDPETMKELVHALMRIRIRPYYLYHCHYVQGGTHFQTTIEKGKEIIKKLQGYTTGMAVPRYIVSTPKGKIPITNSYVVSEDEKEIVLRNFDGEKVRIDKKEGPV